MMGLEKESLPLNAEENQPLPLADAVVELEKSWRFAPGGGIFRLQRAILAAGEDRGAALREILSDDPSGEVRVRTVPETGSEFAAFLVRELGAVRVEQPGGSLPLADYARVADPARAFELFNSFRLLSPLRRSLFGVENLNRLAPEGLGLDAGRSYYRGRPVMITRNDPGIGLYNGDIGLLLPDREGRLRAWFAGPEGRFEKFSPIRLPAHESAFAVTVHKAQGSGFAHVVLLWPGRDNPLLTREMLYTAVTRAARRIEIWLPRGVGVEALVAAAQRAGERPSGLYARLKTMEE
jgi:exodeoxyribonuclease V alpha subunit